MQPILVLPFVLLTVLCWGNYGPLMHEGQHAMQGSLRPFICVGFAYFAIAVVIPALLLRWQRETGRWSIGGAIWSLIAGAVGALGALGVIMAFRFQGKPVYVMPLVFGGAPVVNTVVTMLLSRTLREARLVFYLGVLLVALGAAGVLYFQPRRPPDASHAQAARFTLTPALYVGSDAGSEAVQGRGFSADAAQATVSFADTSDGSAAQESSQPAENKDQATSTPGGKSDTADRAEKAAEHAPSKPFDGLAVMASVLTAALCWGAYGPVLHRGQMRMGGSRLRPFLCVGIAYFLIAVLTPVFLLRIFQEPGQWNFLGVLWSLAGGAAGAVGALGIILAFNWGGRPIFVMPLVFGCAPVVNTFTTIVRDQSYAYVSWPFLASLIMVIGGAVTVLVFAPRTQHAPAHAAR